MLAHVTQRCYRLCLASIYQEITSKKLLWISENVQSKSQKLSCSHGKILCSPAHEVENLKPDLIRLELDYYGYLCYTKVMAKSMSKCYLTLLCTMPLIIISLPTFLLVNSFLYTVHKQDSCQYCIVGKESELLLRYSFIAWRQKCDISSLTEFDDCLYWHF